MKTYKHKTTAWRAETHPSVPHHYRLTSPNTDDTYSVPAKLIENSSDWIEQVEKDYEILKWMNKQHGFTKSYTPLFPSAFDIHSVKRSDGEVVSIDDDVYHVESLSGKVESIHETVDGINIVYSKNAVSYVTNLNEIKKCKRKPILTSENGVELFEGDDYWWVDLNTKNKTIHNGIITKGGYSTMSLYFSTREAAEEYRMNKARVLSMDDVMSIIAKSHTPVTELKELVKSRLK